MLTLCLRAVLISSPDTWDWTRMHLLEVMHRRTVCENVSWTGPAEAQVSWTGPAEAQVSWTGQWQNKGAFLYYRYRYFTRGIDASYRHTSYRYIDASLHP